jgi:hypothetical protein
MTRFAERMRCVVITTIFPPSEAISRFSRLSDWRLVVVGDEKTPRDWSFPGARYLGIEEQKACGFDLAQKLPWNHYARKMLGYLEAVRLGAELIADSDDDNVPNEAWRFPPFQGTYDRASDDLGFVNVYRSFTDQPIWPRGFPLRRINDDSARLSSEHLRSEPCRVGIWQALADGDPDVDSIYRLTNNAPCVFQQREPIVLGAGTISTCNSQNTAFAPECFPLLYLPATVAFRFTDIVRGLVAQPILWTRGIQLGFCSANVFQERNAHDFLNDFRSEISCYLQTERVAEIARANATAGKTIAGNLVAVYRALAEENIVQPGELDLLDSWLSDLRGSEVG